VLSVVTAYAEALLSQPTEDTAMVDLVYSPWLVDVLANYVAVAPQELASKAQPLLARAEQALSTLGLDDASVQDVAAGRLATEGEDLDGATLQLRLQATLLQALGPTPGDLFDLVDLGEVTPEVATASGYGCLGG
jgi:hypothetical protein